MNVVPEAHPEPDAALKGFSAVKTRLLADQQIITLTACRGFMLFATGVRFKQQHDGNKHQDRRLLTGQQLELNTAAR